MGWRFSTGWQVIPIVGLFIIFFGMALAGPYVWGFLPHLITIGLICDVSRKRFSRNVLIVPILAYSAYYAFFAHEFAVIHSVENRLTAENSAQVIDFDPSRHALVAKGGEGLVIYNKIPVVYEENGNFPEGYFSHRLVSAQRCKEINGVKRETFDFDNFGVHWSRGKELFNSKFLEQCQLRTHERPAKDIVRISAQENKISINGVELFETSHTVIAQNKTIAVVKDATAMRLPVFPFIIAMCGPVSSSWKCEVGFYRSNYLLKTNPHDAVEKYGANPIADLLKLEKYKESDFSDFRDYPENAAFIESWLSAKRNETADDFNEWGVRKDSLYIPRIDSSGEIPSYRGVIYTRKQGGPFYDFIRRNEGKTVYIDATLGPGVNRSQNLFGIYAVCKEERTCGRIDHWYELVNGDIPVPISGKITGHWKVSAAEVRPDAEDPRGDTMNILTLVEGESQRL